MRKFAFILITLLSISSVYSQYEETNDPIVVTAVAVAHKEESDLLKEIDKKQARILVPTTLTATQTVQLSLRQQRLFNAMYKLYDAVDNLQLIYQISVVSVDIMDKLDAIYNLVKDNPETKAIAGIIHSNVLIENVKTLADLFKATLQSKVNLINNKQRLELLVKTLDSLTQTSKFLSVVYVLLDQDIQFQEIYQYINEHIDIPVDVEKIYNEIDNELNKLFPDTIK